jgi:hypothetical protein
VLTFALLVNVAAPIGGVPGTTQVVWHAAACELHNIMQAVTAEVCASAVPPRAFTTQPTAKNRTRVDNRRMTASGFFARRHHNAVCGTGECRIGGVRQPRKRA